MRAETSRLWATICLALAAVALAFLALAWVVGQSIATLLILLIATLVAVVVALSLIVAAARAERRLMDRIDQ